MGDDEPNHDTIANTAVVVAAGRGLVEYAILKQARETGRTPEEQKQRLGDRFAYTAVEQDDHQRQLDDYADTTVVTDGGLPTVEDHHGTPAPTAVDGVNLKHDGCPVCGTTTFEEFPAGHYHCTTCQSSWTGDPENATIATYFGPAPTDLARRNESLPVDIDANCRACFLNPRKPDARLCPDCHDALATDGGVPNATDHDETPGEFIDERFGTNNDDDVATDGGVVETSPETCSECGLDVLDDVDPDDTCGDCRTADHVWSETHYAGERRVTRASITEQPDGNRSVVVDQRWQTEPNYDRVGLPAGRIHTICAMLNDDDAPDRRKYTDQFGTPSNPTTGTTTVAVDEAVAVSQQLDPEQTVDVVTLTREMVAVLRASLLTTGGDPA